MEITFLGYLSIILTVVFIFQCKPIMFLYAAIFFMGFTGSSVLNISDFSIQPSYYFFLIYFIYDSFISIRKRNIKIYVPKMLIIFFLYCCLTVVFPFILKNQNIVLMNVDGRYVKLSFSSSNITQLMYLALCMLFINTIYKIKIDEVKDNLYTAFKLGFVAVILICIYQLIAFEFNLEFDYFFRQGVHGNVQGTRLYGPCSEASTLCYYLLPSCVLILLNNKNIWDIIWVILGIAIGLLSYSSTFILGAILCIIYFMVKALTKTKIKVSKKFWLFAILILAFVVWVILEFDYVSRLFVSLLTKLNGETMSGEERSETFTTMALIGLRYPFGVGFGSSRSKDLLSTWMCNIGIVGITIFIVFLIDYIIGCRKKKTLKNAYVFLLVVILMSISVPEPFNLFIWFFMWYGNRGCRRKMDANKLKVNSINKFSRIELKIKKV